MSKLWRPSRRLFLAGGASLIASPAIVRAQSPILAFPPGVFQNRAALDAAGGGGGSTATFDPANKFQITLSGGNLAATNSVGPGNFGNARGTTSKSTGKFYVEWTVVFSVSDQMGIGLCDTTQSFGSGFFMGGVIHAIGTHTTSGVSRIESAGGGGISINYSSSGATTGDVIGMAIDVGAGLLWVRANAGGWNNDILANQNPATGTGGVSNPLTGALYLCCDIESSTITGTLNTGGSSYVNAAPSGFGHWT